jgi:hypothetical protein
MSSSVFTFSSLALVVALAIPPVHTFLLTYVYILNDAWQVANSRLQFTGEGYADGESIHFAISHSGDGLNWTELNGGRPSLRSNVGTGGVRDPTILRSTDGSRVWILATVRVVARNCALAKLIAAGPENV